MRSRPIFISYRSNAKPFTTFRMECDQSTFDEFFISLLSSVFYLTSSVFEKNNSVTHGDHLDIDEFLHMNVIFFSRKNEDKLKIKNLIQSYRFVKIKLKISYSKSFCEQSKALFCATFCFI